MHNIRSLHNVGSMFRTADAMGVKKIYLTGYTPAPFDIFGKVRKDFQKTALGAESYVEWEKIKSINSVFKKVKKEKVFIAALEQAKNSILLCHFATKSLLSNPIAKRGVAVVVGNEVKGISPAILKKCDRILEIPMLGKKESLNVSVAAGIALYAFSR